MSLFSSIFELGMTRLLQITAIKGESAKKKKNHNFIGNTAKDNDWFRRNKQFYVVGTLFLNSPVSDIDEGPFINVFMLMHRSAVPNTDSHE